MTTEQRGDRALIGGTQEDAFSYYCRGIETILSSLDALVYVADMETHELLFLNEYGRKRWGEPSGRKCWQVLQVDQQSPCEFCTNPCLVDADGNSAGVYVWEFQNTKNGRWYQCRDRAIRWLDGRLVRMEIATDITDRKQMEAELLAARKRADLLAHTDELTGLHNRRAFFQLGEQYLRQARRYGYSTATIMFDVDHFKRINDTYGHAVGDEVLRSLADSVKSAVRDSDILARLGGEEFGLILPRTDLALALALAERLRTSVCAAGARHGADVVRCTASFGVAACDSGQTSLDALLAQTDHALLKAKRGGRNRIESRNFAEPAPKNH